MTGFAHVSVGLHPAKAFFDAFANALADRVTRMPGCSSVDGGSAIGGVLCHMRRDTQCSQLGDEVCYVISLVRRQCDSVAPIHALKHGECRLTLGSAGGMSGLD